MSDQNAFSRNGMWLAVLAGAGCTLGAVALALQWHPQNPVATPMPQNTVPVATVPATSSASNDELWRMWRQISEQHVQLTQRLAQTEARLQVADKEAQLAAQQQTHLRERLLLAETKMAQLQQQAVKAAATPVATVIEPPAPVETTPEVTRPVPTAVTQPERTTAPVAPRALTPLEQAYKRAWQTDAVVIFEVLNQTTGVKEGVLELDASSVKALGTAASWEEWYQSEAAQREEELSKYGRAMGNLQNSQPQDLPGQ